MAKECKLLDITEVFTGNNREVYLFILIDKVNRLLCLESTMYLINCVNIWK